MTQLTKILSFPLAALGFMCHLRGVRADAASCEVDGAVCGQSMIQLGATPAQRTISPPSPGSGTVWAFVATDVFAGSEMLQAAILTLAGVGGFRGDIIVATDLPQCALTTIFNGIDHEALRMASQMERTQPQFALMRDNRTQWSSLSSLQSLGMGTSGNPPSSMLPAHIATIDSPHLPGIALHVIQLQPGEVFDAKLAKTHVWDFAKLAGLQPRQIVYQDADIMAGEQVAPFLAFIDGEMQATPGIPSVLTMQEQDIVDRLASGATGIRVPINGGASDESTDWMEVQVASASEAAKAGTLLFGSYYGGRNTRHGGLILTRAGAGERCLEDWRTAMLEMKAEDPELTVDQPALATLHCNFAYLPWQYMHFPTPETLQGDRTAVFMHFAANSIMHLFEEDDSHVLDDFLSSKLGLHGLKASHLMDTTDSDYCKSVE